MEKGEVRVGMLLELKDDCSRWRVICHVAKTFRMIDVSAKSLVFKDMEYVEITQSILKGSLRIVEDEDFYVFDIDALSEKSREESIEEENSSMSSIQYMVRRMNF